MSIRVRPFIGIQSFEEANGSFFYGRDREIQEILALILSSGVSLVYSKSGIGKTSIFNAKIIPELQGDKYRCHVLPVTRFKTLSTLTDQKEKESEIPNPFIFNTLQDIVEKSTSLLEHENLLKDINKMTLSEFLKEYVKLNKEDVFDKYYHKIRILIFDQFEEFFNIYISNRFEQQKNFFYQIKDAINNDPSLRVVFIMREEFVANLDTFSYILPDGFRRKFRLEPLRKESAIQAVEKPMLQTLAQEPKLKEIINEEDIKKIADKVVENLLKIYVQRYDGKTEIINGEFVEPVQLQVVCQRLWDKNILAGKIKNEIDSIQFGDVDNALTDFYVDAVTVAKATTKTKEHDIREWCEEKLITTAGTRGIVYQDVKVTAGMSNKVVNVLQNKYLIRAEERGGGKWFELTHDRMIKPIRDSNKNYEEKEKRNLYRIIKILVPVIAAISLFAIFINLPYFESLAVQDKKVETLINNNVTIKMKYNHSFPLSSYTYFIKSYPKNGMLIPVANDTIVYDPNHRYVGHDTFTYVVNNGKKNSSNGGLVDIRINHIPLKAINQTVESIIDKPRILSLIDWDYPKYTNIRDVGTLPIKLLYPPINGYLTSDINSNKIIYTPHNKYNGTDYFEFCLPNPENTTMCNSIDKYAYGHVNINIKAIPKYSGYLMIDNGITQGTLYPIYSTTNTIGRATFHDNPDIPITDQIYSGLDQSVSRLHGKIFYANNSFYLQDLESTNKIIWKGKKLDDREIVELKGGDTFVMGDTRIRLITNLTNTNVTQYK